MRIADLLLKGLTFTFLILAPADVFACSCMASGPPCQNAFRADAVFAGTVRRITPLPDDGPPLRPGEVRIPQTLRVEFGDVLGYRGVQDPAVSISTNGSGPACGYAFKQGERYLVYAFRANDGSGLIASICSRTRLLKDAEEDLRFLQSLPTTGGRARIYGKIVHGERDLASGTWTEVGPVADVIVSARGAGPAVEAVTDARGRYEIAVPPGKYEVSAIPPVSFSTRYLQQQVELRDPRACFVQDFTLQFDGRISGLARQASGEPAANASVQVMSPDSVGKTGNIDTLRVQSDASGRFQFTDVAPGRYLVGVDLTRRMDAEVVFPTTYYPGTSDVAKAMVVELAGGERRELDTLALPPPRRPQRLTGTVVFADGRPAAGAFISLNDGQQTWRQVAVGIKTSSDGSFSFLVHEGLSYVASASFWDEVRRAQGAGTVGPFVVNDKTGPLRVVLLQRQ